MNDLIVRTCPDCGDRTNHLIFSPPPGHRVVPVYLQAACCPLMGCCDDCGLRMDHTEDWGNGWAYLIPAEMTPEALGSDMWPRVNVDTMLGQDPGSPPERWVCGYCWAGLYRAVAERALGVST